jgi:DNA repair protein RecN (Recombination protein N)
MPEAKISFLIEKTESFNAYGRDKVSLYFCANRGEDLKPIAKIASGGELSRVLLAFKIAMQNDNRVSTLIFDEVDEGIGGEVGRHIGLKLRELSKRVQVVAISHLPQVASKADHHFVISKSIKDERTVSNIQTLDNDARKYEIARMIYGDAVDDITLEQANVMLTS